MPWKLASFGTLLAALASGRDIGDAPLGYPQLGMFVVTGARDQLTHSGQGQALGVVQINLHAVFPGD